MTELRRTPKIGLEDLILPAGHDLGTPGALEASQNQDCGGRALRRFSNRGITPDFTGQESWELVKDV